VPPHLTRNPEDTTLTEAYVVALMEPYYEDVTDVEVDDEILDWGSSASDEAVL
jgi:hypothetical protein